MDDTYVEVANNTLFSNELQGVTCHGSEFGVSNCTIVGNDAYWNRMGGIGFAGDAQGSALQNVVACNSQSGIQTKDLTSEEEIAIYNNIAWANVRAGVLDLGELHDFNLLSANAGQEPTCGDDQQANQCKNPQVGGQSGGVPGPNDLFVDPAFIDPSGFDFGLQTGSPAIDSGTDVSQYCSSWPVEGSGPDRGSHEQ